jgi:hypothetical protein
MVGIYIAVMPTSIEKLYGRKEAKRRWAFGYSSER